MRRLVALILTVIPAIAVAASQQFSPPKPLESNPTPPYPAAAQDKGVEGTVSFRVRVDEQGQVVDVVIVSVPGPDLGFEPSVQETVRRWGFEAAMLDGRPVASTYVGSVAFTFGKAMATAQMFARDSKATWEAVLKVAKEAGIDIRERDRKHQFFISAWQPIQAASLGNLRSAILPERFVDGRFQLQVFVSPFVEPARVYVTSMVEGDPLQSHNVRPIAKEDFSRRFYNQEPLHLWFLERLAATLGTQGHSVPESAKARVELARKTAEGLKLTVEDCHVQLGAYDRNAVAKPQVIESSQMLPIYPAVERREGDEAYVRLKILILEDGTPTHPELLESDRPEVEFAATARQTVSFWRFVPARFDGCPVPFEATVGISFRLRR